MKYLLCKIGPYLTVLGTICAWMIGNDPNTNAWMTTSRKKWNIMRLFLTAD